VQSSEWLRQQRLLLGPTPQGGTLIDLTRAVRPSRCRSSGGSAGHACEQPPATVWRDLDAGLRRDLLGCLSDDLNQLRERETEYLVVVETVPGGASAQGHRLLRSLAPVSEPDAIVRRRQRGLAPSRPAQVERRPKVDVTAEHCLPVEFHGIESEQPGSSAGQELDERSMSLSLRKVQRRTDPNSRSRRTPLCRQNFRQLLVVDGDAGCMFHDVESQQAGQWIARRSPAASRSRGVDGEFRIESEEVAGIRGDHTQAALAGEEGNRCADHVRGGGGTA